MPHLLNSSRKESGERLSVVPEVSPHVRQMLAHMDDRQYGYTSPRASPPNNIDGTHDCRDEDTFSTALTMIDSPNGLRFPAKVYSWAPKVCYQPEAALIRHASPV